ncbi:unnamed protein product [Hyaloperonospora brassicae]|uniref:RxLR effector candidate protein n=1 Tax=Hyaloperonospora brassicae TaxID=162125 RepID=A0AAV0UYW8_HYABA|nr:unnamed protein product [Hyaloperonospora brassicae]
MHLYAVELGAALFLVCVGGDSAAYALKLSTAERQPQSRLLADERIDTESPTSLTNFERLDKDSEERVFPAQEMKGIDLAEKMKRIDSWVSETLTQHFADSTMKAAGKPSHLDDETFAAAQKQSISTPQNKRWTVDDENFGVSSIGDPTRPSHFDGVVDAPLTAKWSTSNTWEETTSAFELSQQPRYEKWVKEGLSGAEAAHKLDFDDYKGLAQNLKTLKGYIKFRQSQETLLECMTKYWGDEELLVSFIGRAKMNKGGKSAAEELENLLIAKWLGDENMNPAELLRVMGMETIDDLISPKLNTVLKYVEVYILRSKDTSFSVLAPVRKKLGDEEVARVLNAASKDPFSSVTRDIAETLLTLLKMEWLSEGKPREATVATIKALSV